jgi:hypothetical protein
MRRNCQDAKLATPRLGRRLASASGVPLLLAISLAVPCLFPLGARADDSTEVAATEKDRVVRMQRFMVSATRIDKNPWRYASVHGFEVLTRASARDTEWWLGALQRGYWLEGRIIPGDWLPDPAVPYTVIIDDTGERTIPASALNSRTVSYHRPPDHPLWGKFQGAVEAFNDESGAYDGDTFSLSANVHSADTSVPVYGTMSMERVSRCAPRLPPWLLAGLIGENCGLFRESFALELTTRAAPSIKAAVGPGTIWISLENTEMLLEKLRRNERLVIPMLPLGELFAEAPPSRDKALLWESEAALFVRWSLMGPGREDAATFGGFQELVRRARRGPVSEKMFSECLGCGYSSMLGTLETYLEKEALGQPTSVKWNLQPGVLDPVDLREATSDQIGRILGDRLRMEGDSLRYADPGLSRDFLRSAGRMLERAYRDDNGLPPDVDPSKEGEGQPDAHQGDAVGVALVMKPFVVTAAHIHDPRLQAVYGMYEHDVGKDEKAREFLEAAAKAKVVRPMAYVALAEILAAEAKEKPFGPDEMLSAGQAAHVLDLLFTAFQGSPTPDLCTRMLDTLSDCEAKPDEKEIARIAGCAALFPRDMDVAYTAATLCAQYGYPALAAGLIDGAAGLATYDFDRDDFAQLRSTLGVPMPK